MEEEGKQEEEARVALPDKCHSLRLRSIRKRLETERRNKENEIAVDESEASPAKKPRSRRRRSAPLSRYRRKTANARERDRMRHVNDAFEKLKGSIPHHTLFQEVEDKKDTKITTLRCAITYINSLSDLLDDLSHGRDVHPAFYRTDAELGIEDLDAARREARGESPRRKRKKKRKSGKKAKNKGPSSSSTKSSRRQTGKANKGEKLKRQLGLNGGRGRGSNECLANVAFSGGGSGTSREGLLRFQPQQQIFPPSSGQPCQIPQQQPNDILQLLPRVPLDVNKCGSYCSSSSPASSPSPPASVASASHAAFPFGNGSAIPPPLAVQEEVIIEDTDQHPIMGADLFVAGQQNNKPVIHIQEQQPQQQQQQQQLQVECSATVLQELLTSIEAFEAATASANSVYIVQTQQDFSLDIANQT